MPVFHKKKLNISKKEYKNHVDSLKDSIQKAKILKESAVFQIFRRSWQSPGITMSCCLPGKDGEILQAKIFARITRDMLIWPTKLPDSMV